MTRPSVRIAAIVATAALVACSGDNGGQASPNPSTGQLDTTYAAGGRYSQTQPGFLTGPASTRRIAVSGDGSVYFAGAVVRRLDPGGNLDAGYLVDLPSSSPLLDEAGNLYVLAEQGIAKLDAAGKLVTAFGAQGFALATWLTPGTGRFARDGAGNFALVGGGSDAYYVAKFDREGRPIASFGNTGRLALAVPGGMEQLAAVGFDAAGNIFLGGAQATRGIVVKLDPDGRLVPAFGGAGVWIAPPICAQWLVEALAFDASGFVYAGCGPIIAKLDNLANPDPTFGLLGMSTALNGQVTSIRVVANGEVFAAGQAGTNPAPCTDFVVARLDVRGGPVQEFGQQGRVVLHVNASDWWPTLGVDGAGRLYMGGQSISGCQILRPVAESTTSVFRLR